jgi:hypothetical protein
MLKVWHFISQSSIRFYYKNGFYFTIR